MKVNSTSGTPITGRRHGQIFTAPGETNIARSRIVPLQPRSNSQISGSISVAAAAQYWKLITPTDQALWENLFGLGGAAYNNFVAINSNAISWGSASIIDAPYTPAIRQLEFAAVYAEPDGVSTTLVLVCAPGTPSPVPFYCRLYLDFHQRGPIQQGKSSGATYFGSFGPLAPNNTNFFDVTARMLEVTGQWFYPASIDTTSQLDCGTQVYGEWYMTDVFGMPAVSKTANQFCGVRGGLIGPGVCPSVPGPPYPWPTATEFYPP